MDVLHRIFILLLNAAKQLLDWIMLIGGRILHMLSDLLK